MFELSQSGEARRERILNLAKFEARRRRRSRRVIHASSALIAVMTISVIVWLVPQSSPTQIAVHPALPAPTPSAQIVRIERIETDPQITARLAIAPAKPIWKTINDRELLQALADAGKPAGLIEIDGRAMLVQR